MTNWSTMQYRDRVSGATDGLTYKPSWRLDILLFSRSELVASRESEVWRVSCCASSRVETREPRWPQTIEGVVVFRRH